MFQRRCIESLMLSLGRQLHILIHLIQRVRSDLSHDVVSRLVQAMSTEVPGFTLIVARGNCFCSPSPMTISKAYAL
jgi:hypothetical protein